MSNPAGKVVIVGAGAVGTTFAYALQIHGAAREIVLIDMDMERARGEALDLGHGAFFTPPVDIRAGDYGDCAGADMVAICAGAKQKPGQSRTDLVGTNAEIYKDIVQKIVEQTTEAILLVVTNPVDVLTYAALKFSGLPRERVIGSGTVLDSARFRYLLSRHCGVDSRNVHAYVLGEHGDSEVVAWSITNIAGMRMGDYCKTCHRNCPGIEKEGIVDEVRDSAYHIIEAKGATNFAVGLALVKIATSILRDESSVLTVSALMDGEYGIRDVCLSIPTILSRSGADRRVAPDITEAELRALRSSADAIRSVQEQVGLK
jgi:L-lactate dehydrogenase